MFKRITRRMAISAFFIFTTVFLSSTVADTSKAAIIECDSGAACSSAIANAQPGDTINLTADLLNQSATALTFNAKSGITFDGNSHIIEGNGVAGPGIIFTNTTDTVLKNMTVRNWKGGFTNGSNIYINGSLGNTFENVISMGSGYSGFYLNNSSNNTIINCESKNNAQRGFVVSGSNFNTITDTLVDNNSNVGIFIGTGSSSDNIIKSNHITNNGNEALYFYSNFGSSTNYRNQVYNNYFSNAFKNVNTSGIHSTTLFNTTLAQAPNIVGGPYMGGNYWGNPGGTGFSQTCTDTDTDGICDSTYIIAGTITDNHPLTDYTLIVDTEKPVITLNGPAIMDVEYGSVYTELGAIWTDNVDGTGEAVVGGFAVHTDVLGTYSVTYNYIDQAGNEADEVVRTVNVVDTQKPVITLLGDLEVTLELNSEYFDAGATATDNYDGDLTASIMVDDYVDTTTPGDYTVAFNVSDSSGNPADEVIRIVHVVDTTVTGKIISNFETGDLQGWTQEATLLEPGSTSGFAMRLINPSYGSAGAQKIFNEAVLAGYDTLEFDINLNGQSLLQGDASALAFEQGGWKWISIANYVNNGYDGWQHITIPLSHFAGLDVNSGIAFMTFRFWNYNSGNYDIDNIYLEASQLPGLVSPSNLIGQAISDAQINLSWQGNGPAYRIYQDGVMIGETNETSYSVTGLNPNTTYTFYITATDGTNESPSSPSASIKTLETHGTVKILSDFESGTTDDWGQEAGVITPGSNSNFGLRLTNPANGSAGALKQINSEVAKGYSNFEFDINLNGNTILPGDAAAVVFEQAGWKMASIVNYATNGLDGWQHIIIPFADITGFDPNSGVAHILFRFWNYGSGSYDIDNLIFS